MIGDNYLHVQRWRPNFCAMDAKISSLPVWVRFPDIPLEYFDEEWLRRVGDELGKTIKVDNTTRATTRGRFARVCVEIDMGKLLAANLRLRGKVYRLQYEGLQDLCFTCGKYGHREEGCPVMMAANQDSGNEASAAQSKANTTNETIRKEEEPQRSFGPWMVVNRRRRAAASQRVNSGNSKGKTAGNGGENQGNAAENPQVVNANQGPRQSSANKANANGESRARQTVSNSKADFMEAVKGPTRGGDASVQQNPSGRVAEKPKTTQGRLTSMEQSSNTKGSRFSILGEEMETETVEGTEQSQEEERDVKMKSPNHGEGQKQTEQTSKTLEDETRAKKSYYPQCLS